MPDRFYETFSKFEAKSVVTAVPGMVASKEGRSELGRFFVRALCDRYRGDYNPHYLTGLGSAFWVADRCSRQAPIVINALYQYVDFLFDGLKSEG